MLNLTRWLVVVTAMVILPGCQAAMWTLPTAETPGPAEQCPGGVCPSPEATYLSPESPSLPWESQQESQQESPEVSPEASLSRPLFFQSRREGESRYLAQQCSTCLLLLRLDSVGMDRQGRRAPGGSLSRLL